MSGFAYNELLIFENNAKSMKIDTISKAILLLIVLLISTPELVNAQRFKAGGILGFNAAQIDGDAAAGYNKLGIEAGIRGVAILSDKTELSVEMLFSQRGSQANIGGSNGIILTNVRLNYVSIPVMFNLLDWLSDDEYYYRLNFSAGLSYGRLINAKLSEDLILLQDELNENDFSWVAGATYYINQNFGLTLRYNRWITLLYNNRGNVNARSLGSYFLNFHAVYMF